MNPFSQSSLLRFLGYTLLIMSVIDLIDTLVPLRLMDPLWRFQAMGQLVERVPVPLIGLVTVFYGDRDRLAKWERSLLKLLSWAALLVGTGYLLLVLVGVFSTLQIDRFNDNQVKQQIARSMTELEAIKGQLKGIKTEAQMQAFLSNIQGLPPEIKESKQLEYSKKKVTDLITKGAETSINQLKQNYFDQRLQLLKQSVKWNIGSLISGVLLIVIWRITEYARSSEIIE